jgi:hypothetical protein
MLVCIACKGSLAEKSVSDALAHVRRCLAVRDELFTHAHADDTWARSATERPTSRYGRRGLRPAAQR